MDFGSFPQAQWRSFSEVGQTTERIRARCNQLIELIIASSVKPSLLGMGNFEIKRTDDPGVLADIKTPVGSGRLALEWSLAGAELFGMLMFEREGRDKYGAVLWEPVWGLMVPEYDDPFSGEDGSALRIPLNSAFGSNLSNAVFTAVMSMLFGLVNGPVTNTK